jgi:hypothetical protein
VLHEQHRRRDRVEPAQPQIGQALGGKRGALAPGGEDDRDALGMQPARREHQRVRGGPVQPVSVIDKTQQRVLLGELGKQRQHRQADKETVGGRHRAQAECPTQGVLLRPGQASKLIQHRPEQHVQASERQFGFGFGSGTADHPDGGRLRPRCPGGQGSIVKQGRLADAGLAAKDKRPAAPRPRSRDQSADGRLRCRPAMQHRGLAGHDARPRPAGAALELGAHETPFGGGRPVTSRLL